MGHLGHKTHHARAHQPHYIFCVVASGCWVSPVFRSLLPVVTCREDDPVYMCTGHLPVTATVVMTHLADT
jgi:hypothetical protein